MTCAAMTELKRKYKRNCGIKICKPVDFKILMACNVWNFKMRIELFLKLLRTSESLKASIPAKVHEAYSSLNSLWESIVSQFAEPPLVF